METRNTVAQQQQFQVLNDYHNQLLLARFGADAFDAAYPKEDHGMVGRSMSSARHITTPRYAVKVNCCCSTQCYECKTR